MASPRILSTLRELWQHGPGKAGLIMLGTLILLSLFVIITYPAKFGTEHWANPGLWADNPKSAPPAWVNPLSRTKRPKHLVFELGTPDEKTSTRTTHKSIYIEDFTFSADLPPSFLSMSLSEVSYNRRPPIVTAILHRPDGGEIVLNRYVIAGPRRSEDAPYLRHDEEPLRTVMGSEERVIDDLIGHFSEVYSTEISRQSIRATPEAALFGTPLEGGNFEILKGDYRLEVQVLANHEEDTLGTLRLVVGGSLFGIMGTDALGRDLARGLLYGLPIALLIGIATATVSTFLGMSIGMVSGYVGGWVDVVIQRAADIVANVPVLPLLIFLVFIGGSRLWLILLVLVAFSWPGLTIMVRTMVLQLRTGQEVESSRALGASGARIIYRHILPHAASYILAQLVFFAPSAILAEAGLSFLGLGDPTIPTWGQILEYGFKTGAVFLGYWWWVIPPGLLIVITAVTFMFLALGLEPVVDPRLRGRRSWHF